VPGALEVVDQGCGLQPENGSEHFAGVGITGMRERVRELGGQFDVKSGAEGTQVRAVLPIGERTVSRETKFQSDLA
jgi:signal transduction histidine kinase